MKLAFVLQFISRWKTIYQSCDLGRTDGRSNVDINQKRSLFTNVCVALVTYRHDVKRGRSGFWLFQALR